MCMYGQAVQGFPETLDLAIAIPWRTNLYNMILLPQKDLTFKMLKCSKFWAP